MRRRDLLAAAAGLAASACTRQPTRGLTRLRVALAPTLPSSSLFLALERGYFREAGFELETIHTGSPAQSLTLLAGGRIDVYLARLTAALLNAVLKGLKIRIVAGRDDVSTSCGDLGSIYGLRRRFPRGFEDISVLRGKRIAAGTSVGLAHFALDAHLARAGLSTRDVTLVHMTLEQNVAALVAGSIDAMMGVYDIDPGLLAQGAGVVRTPGLAALHPGFQYSNILFGRTLLEAPAEQGARFLAAYLRGAREFAAGATPRFVAELIRAKVVDPDKARSACRDSFSLDGRISGTSVRLFASWAARRGHVQRAPELAELIDLRFLNLNAK